MRQRVLWRVLSPTGFRGSIHALLRYPSHAEDPSILAAEVGGVFLGLAYRSQGRESIYSGSSGRLFVRAPHEVAWEKTMERCANALHATENGSNDGNGYYKAVSTISVTSTKSLTCSHRRVMFYVSKWCFVRESVVPLGPSGSCLVLI